MNEEEDTLYALSYILLRRSNRRKLGAKRAGRMWVTNILRGGESGGVCRTLVREMGLGDREYYFR